MNLGPLGWNQVFTPVCLVTDMNYPCHVLSKCFCKVESKDSVLFIRGIGVDHHIYQRLSTTKDFGINYKTLYKLYQAKIHIY